MKTLRKNPLVRWTSLGLAALLFGCLMPEKLTVMAQDPAETMQTVEGDGDGLLGSYFNNRQLYGAPVMNRVDPTIDYDFGALVGWKSGATINTINTNQCLTVLGMAKGQEFSIRWTGEIQPQFTEPYTLHVTSDDGVRVWLNEQLVIDDWGTHTARESLSSPLNLVAGQHYLLRIEYFQDRYDAMIRLAWSSPSTPCQVVPQSQLYSKPTDADGNGLPDLWELHYFGRTGVDPNADADGDGWSNLQEYQRFSDPIDPQSPGLAKGWWQGDFGNDTGTASLSNGVFTVTASGSDIWDEFDSFHYTYYPIGTNAQIVTRLLGLSGTQPWMKAGLMIRETLNGGSRNAALLLTCSNGMDFQWRPAADGKTLQYVNPTNTAAISWLKLSRNGNWVGAFTSSDGTNWTLFDWETVNGLAPRVYAGLAVSSFSESESNTAWFDQVSVGPANPAEVLNPVVGNGDGLAGSYRSDSLLYLPGITNRCDAMVGFDWEHEDFDQLPPMINPDSYGICWSGEIQAQFTEPYTFAFECHDEEWVRIWLNEQLIMDGWRVEHPEGRLVSAPVNLTAGQRCLIRVEVYDNQSRGRARLKWSSPSTPEMPVPQCQLYSRPTDTDSNGLPDIWEQIYFGHIGVDPNADPDGDGLSNLQEYQYHTNPLKADTDSDGIPDAWEIAHGLDPQFPDANLDYDNSGFSDLQDYQMGLDPLNIDRNGDGLPDWFEEQYLGTGTSLICTSQVTVALTVNGSQATNYLGAWQVEGSDIYALDRRGGVDFNLPIQQADKYVLNLVGTQNQANTTDNSFKLLLGIDKQNLGHYLLNAGYGTNGVVELVLPYLPAGNHVFHLFWDGVAGGTLRIERIKLLAVSGSQTKGIKDWARAMMADQCGLDQTNAVIGSYTSPVCLEGCDPYPVLARMTNDLTNTLSATATTDGRWFINAPLQAGTQTVFQASYQNGGFNQTRQLQWLPVNLLTATDGLTIRQGDSLLFNALPTGGANGGLQVVVGNSTYKGKTANGIPCQFNNAGIYTVSGTYLPPSGVSQKGSITVKVVQQNLPQVPADAWTAMQRNLNLTNLAPETVLQADSRLACALTGTNGNGQAQLTLGTDVNEQRSILARLGTNGPVLSSALVSGFDIYSGDQAYTKVVQTYADGSQLVEMLMISSPVLPQVTFELNIIVSGVIFDDGTTTKILTATNFDALGQCPVRFIRPASTSTSVCNGIRAYQAPYLIGVRH